MTNPQDDWPGAEFHGEGRGHPFAPRTETQDSAVEEARRRIYDLCDEYGIATRPLVEALEAAITREAEERRTLWLLRHLYDALGWGAPDSAHHILWDTAVANVRQLAERAEAAERERDEARAALTRIRDESSEPHEGEHDVRGLKCEPGRDECSNCIATRALTPPTPPAASEGGE